MEQAIVITRSQLRQVIEDYIAASRVGDTLSYVETAKLSAAEAAESSTSRIWDGLCEQEPVAYEPDVSRVVFALERQIAVLKKQCDDLAARRDYSAEFPADDIEALERARCMVIESVGTVSLSEPRSDNFAEDLEPGILVPLPPEEFVCAEDLAASQVVVVNSRGMIEGKRDDADGRVISDRPTDSIEFGFFQAEQLHAAFGTNTDARYRVDRYALGSLIAVNVDEPTLAYELTEPEPEPEDNADMF